MPSRVLKKTLYAFGGALLLAGLIGLIAGLPAMLFSPDASGPTLTPAPAFAPVEIEEVVVVPHPPNLSSPERSFDVVASLKNPNLRAGVRDYQLTFILYDAAGEVITTKNIATYLLPGARQYAAAVDIRIPARQSLGRVETIKPSEVQFIQLPDTVDLPQFNVFLRQRRARAVGGERIEEQTGIVTNASTFDWERVEVVGVGLDEGGRIVAVGQTFVGRLEVGEQREFTLQWPEPAQAVSGVITLPSTNMFREDNIVDIIGDPSTLR